MQPRRLLVVAAATLAAAGIGAGLSAAGPYSNLLAPAGTCGTADQLNLDPATARSVMLCLTNWARTQSGLAPLRANTTLDAAGDAKLAADVSCNEFTHTPCDKPFQNVFASYLAGAASYSIGENLEWGTGSYGTPRNAMDGWLNSDGHRANILDASYTEVGIGYQPNTTFQGFDGAALWAQEFGTRSAPPTAVASTKAVARAKRHRLRRR